MAEQLTFDEWKEKYKPTTTKVIEDYAENKDVFKLVCDLYPHSIWTLVEFEGEGYLVNRLAYVNRLGHYITKVPYDPSIEIEVSMWTNEEDQD